MILLNLSSLYRSMVQNKVDRARFRFQYAKVEFAALFFTDEKPFILTLTAIGTGDHFTFNVLKNNGNLKVIMSLPDSDFNRFMGLLKLNDSAKGFKMTHFFQVFDKNTPAIYSKRQHEPPAHEVAQTRDVDEPDKIYFKDWKVHTVHKARPENLDKTRKLIGYEAYVLCREKNISSVWSDEIKYKNNIPGLPPN
ncbi:hypothetical protein CHH65_12950 [Shouchella clausii]|uniref:DUF6037 family protein n=1 Tax=Shouchella clausii TaxID=79880 RepID=UPI000BA75624|nr:DUF6037 family protein [Shouchella clausii]PAF08935.1 hypothetical protein CHH65_12950 [Shouchella clausii]